MPNIRIADFTPDSNDIFLLDTNILIHLFYPIMSYPYMHPYENLYHEILKKKSKIYLTSIQISEFVNRCIRFQYDLYIRSNNLDRNSCDYKKDYRGTNDYKSCMKAILGIIKHDILPQVTIVNDKFDTMNLDNIFNIGFSYDFNDAILVAIAQEYNASIITHDADFANYSTRQKIISANETLLLFSRH